MPWRGQANLPPHTNKPNEKQVGDQIENKTSKLISLLLCAVMLLAVLPALPAVSAASPQELRQAIAAHTKNIANLEWKLEGRRYNATTFGPNDNLSRAMVVQVLYNKEGQPAITGSNAFPDVKSSDWFNNAVTWASLNSVVGGYGDGTFQPNKNVSLQEVAVILWNYSGNPTPTGDASTVGAHDDWAANALSWAVGKGIFEGMPYDTVTGTATRAQTAQMLMNYLKK